MDDACCANVATVLSFARRHGATNVVLMGRSLGCAVALRAMTTHPRLNNVVSHVVLLSGFSSVRDMCTSEWQKRVVRDRLVNKRNITTLAPSIGVGILRHQGRSRALRARQDAALPGGDQAAIVDMNAAPHRLR